MSQTLWVRLSIWLDLGFAGRDRDRLPTSWEIEQRQPWWCRVPQLEAAVRGELMLRLNFQAWPTALCGAVAAALHYLAFGWPFGCYLPHEGWHRYLRAERRIIEQTERGI